MRRREYAAFVAPSAIVMFGFLLLPLYRTVKWSFERVAYGDPGTFLGLQNYRDALTDPRFGRAVAFTVGLTVATTALLLVLGYVVATLVNQIGRFRPLVLGILLISYVLPHVVGALSFSWLFDSNFGGVANYLLHAVTGQQVEWFSNAWPNRLMIGLNVIWSTLPFAMLIILAGLQGVPEEIIEASKIDGVSTLQRHFYVIAPTIRGVLGFVTLISVMDILRIFDNLIPLAPEAVNLGNESIMLYIFNVAFKQGNQNLGLGSAINVLTIVLILIMLSPFVRGVFREAKVR